MLRHAPAPRQRLRLLAVAIAVLASGCELPSVLPEPVTEQGERLFDLWWLSNWVGLAVAGLVWGLIAAAVVIGVRRRTHEDLPSQIAHNVPLEVLYTAVPLLVVAWLFWLTVDVQEEVVETSAEPDLVVDVVGFTWNWQFTYPDEGVVVTGTYDDPAELVLPVGALARLRLEAAEVIHSFWVPEFLAKRDLIPGLDNVIDVRVTEAGTWTGKCAEYCGLDHYRMYFTVRAVPEAHYRAWIRRQAAEARSSR